MLEESKVLVVFNSQVSVKADLIEESHHKPRLNHIDCGRANCQNVGQDCEP